MVVLGISGIGKTYLVFQTLSEKTFYVKFSNIIFSYREMQQIYIKMKKTLDFTFKNYASLEFLNSLANRLLILDDLCNKIYNDKKFIKLAIAGRHKILTSFI